MTEHDLPAASRKGIAAPSDPPTRQRRDDAGKLKGDNFGHADLTANGTRLGGRGSSFSPDSGAGANERMAMQGSGVGAHSHSGPGRPNAAPHGSALPDSPSPARPISSDDDDDQLSGMGAVAWIVGAIVGIGGLLLGYLAISAIWGPA